MSWDIDIFVEDSNEHFAKSIFILLTRRWIVFPRSSLKRLNFSRVGISVNWIFGLSKFQIYKAAVKKDTICWGYLGTAKSEGSVPNPKPSKLPELLHE